MNKRRVKRKINKKKITITLIIAFTILIGAVAAYSHFFNIDNLISQEPTEEELLEQEKSEIAKQLGEYNVLVLGVDSKTRFTGTRSDSIILATVDTEDRKARMISIPRDTRVKVKGAWDKINSAYAYGGVELAKETVEDFLGVKIDRYVIVNFNSLIEIVDAIGGIEVDVPKRMYYPDENIDLQPGKQLLTGEQVLGYTRFRNDTEGDIGRARRQQEVIQLVGEKVFGLKGLINLPSLINIALDNVETDVPVKEMLALTKLAPDVLNNQVTSIVVPGKNERIDGLWYWSPDLEELEQQLKSLDKSSKLAMVRYSAY